MNELLELALPLSLIFLIAGLVKGVTGMGLPTVAMGLLGSIMSPLAAAALLVIPSLVTNVWQLFVGPSLSTVLRRFWPAMLGIVIGTTTATQFLVSVDPVASRVVLGVALIGYAVYALLSPCLSLAPGHERWMSPLAGLATGAITGVTGVFVIPAVPFFQALNLDKDELVQALGLSFTVSTLALAAGLMMHGAYMPDTMGLSMAAVLPALAGMWLGQKVRARISPAIFRRCFLLFLLALGCELAIASTTRSATHEPDDTGSVEHPTGHRLLAQVPGEQPDWRRLDPLALPDRHFAAARFSDHGDSTGRRRS
ncbi:MAG: sulfite exporter TauE/SafE family protein [Burkholderiaceae bacterium]